MNGFICYLKREKPVLKTNGFISKFFAISRSARQGCPAAPILYIIQAEPMACAIRNTPEIHGIKLTDCEGQPVKEAKICMFADDTQLLNKNEESVEQSFLIISKFEKASGSKINYEKTKGLFIGRLRGKRPRLTNISWISDNIKTLGVFHGYNIDTDDIWKKIINKMKSCTQVWKTRNLTFKGKTLIVKILLLAQMGFETEMRGIAEKYKKEVNDLIWKFLWDNKPNQIERNVFCLIINEGGGGGGGGGGVGEVIIIDNFVKSKQIKFIYKIINSEMDSWNAIGKHWLQKYDKKFGVDFFLCKCSDIKGLDIASIPKYYQDAIQAWNNFLGSCSTESKNDILDKNIFGNSEIKFNRNPLFFQSFLRNNIFKINDIWDKNNNTFVDNQTIFNRLDDKRNWISEWAKIKISIPENFVKKLKSDNNEKIKKSLGLKIDSNLNIRNHNNKIIVPKELKLKNIQKEIRKPITPKCQFKWDTIYEKKFNWISIWYILNKIKCKQSIIQFQWKCLHNIVYSEYRLQKMGKSDGQCHFCKNEIESLMHLFYRCHKIKHVLDELKHIFNSIFEKNIVFVEENLIIGVYEGEITENLLLMNLVICILKWVIWKTRNYIKYNKSTYREAIVITNLKNELRSNIQMMIKNPEVRNLYTIRKLQLLLDTL